MRTEQAIEEALSGTHAPISEALPGALTVAAYDNAGYVYLNGVTLVRLRGEDAGEKATTIARALAAYDGLVGMALFGGPSVTEVHAPEFDHAVKTAFPNEGAKGEAPNRTTLLAEIASTIFDEMPEGGGANLARATELADAVITKVEASSPFKHALSAVLTETDEIREVLRATGHLTDRRSLSCLVDSAIDRERCRAEDAARRFKDRLAKIRNIAVTEDRDD